MLYITKLLNINQYLTQNEPRVLEEKTNVGHQAAANEEVDDQMVKEGIECRCTE